MKIWYFSNNLFCWGTGFDCINLPDRVTKDVTVEGYHIPRDSGALAPLTGFMQVFLALPKNIFFHILSMFFSLSPYFESIVDIVTLNLNSPSDHCAILWPSWSASASTWMNSQPGPRSVGPASGVQTWKVALSRSLSSDQTFCEGSLRSVIVEVSAWSRRSSLFLLDLADGSAWGRLLLRTPSSSSLQPSSSRSGDC